jgi:hypothetical protein
MTWVENLVFIARCLYTVRRLLELIDESQILQGLLIINFQTITERYLVDHIVSQILFLLKKKHH